MVSLVMDTSQFPVMGSEVLLSSGFSKETPNAPSGVSFQIPVSCILRSALEHVHLQETQSFTLHAGTAASSLWMGRIW